MRGLKYLAFLVGVFAFMAFASFQETLTPDETLALSQFEKQVANEQRTEAVASEAPTPGAPSPSTTTPGLTLPVEPSVPLQPEAPLPNGYILEDNVNIRTGPGLDYPVVLMLYKWDDAVLGNLENGWYEIFIDGEKLFISADFAALNPL